MAESEIKVKVKFLRDHGDQKKDSTKTETLSEARRITWAGVVEQQGRTDTKSSG